MLSDDSGVVSVWSHCWLWACPATPGQNANAHRGMGNGGEFKVLLLWINVRNKIKDTLDNAGCNLLICLRCSRHAVTGWCCKYGGATLNTIRRSSEELAEKSRRKGTLLSGECYCRAVDLFCLSELQILNNMNVSWMNVYCVSLYTEVRLFHSHLMSLSEISCFWFFNEVSH